MGNQSDVFYYIYDRTNAPQYAIYYVYNVIKLNENDRMMIGAEMVSKLQVVNDNNSCPQMSTTYSTIFD